MRGIEMRRVLIAAAALVMLSAAPAAAQYGPGTRVTIHPGHVMPLKDFRVRGNGFVPGESVTLTLGRPCGLGASGGRVVGTAVVGPGGSFRTVVGGFPV